MQDRQLEGKTALVTGAARRLGRELALALARQGADVVLHYRDSIEAAKSTAEEIKKAGVKTWLIQTDFQKSGDHTTLIQESLATAGKLDIVINNASVFQAGSLRDLSWEELTQNLEMNAWVPFVLTRDFAGLCGHGAVVNLLDAGLSRLEQTHAAYAVSKHLLTVFTRLTALAYAPRIRVNGIALGPILPPEGKTEAYLQARTEALPLKKSGNPGNVAAAMLYLLKNEFVTGEILRVDGGGHLEAHGYGPHLY